VRELKPERDLLSGPFCFNLTFRLAGREAHSISEAERLSARFASLSRSGSIGRGSSATPRGHPLIAKTGAWRDGFRPALPMPPPAIPNEQVGESIIADARNWMDQGEAKQPSEPDVARGSEPNGNRAIHAYEEAALRINGMQPTAGALARAAICPAKCR
jgi:hypothetical protein